MWSLLFLQNVAMDMFAELNDPKDGAFNVITHAGLLGEQHDVPLWRRRCERTSTTWSASECFWSACENNFYTNTAVAKREDEGIDWYVSPSQWQFDSPITGKGMSATSFPSKTIHNYNFVLELNKAHQTF